MKKQDIWLEKITPENWRLGLKVAEEQKSFVADDMKLLARAYAYREFRSNAYLIYRKDCAIGMALYYDYEPLDAYDFSQLFIDERYQACGYGRKAAALLLEEMKADGKYDKVILCFVQGNVAAKRLYESLGFSLTGEQDGDELIMQKTFEDRTIG
ncbi:MAG: GNAT family N-acetyltransferase [Erysipelotrichaceae bacterium]